MKTNTWLGTLQGQIGLATSFCVFLIFMIVIAPFYITPILISLLPIAFYVVIYKTSILTLLLFSLLFFRVQDLIPALQSYRLVLGCTILLTISLFINLLFKKIRLYWTSEMTYFTAFFIWISVGVVLSHDFSGSFGYWLSFLKISFIFFILIWTLNYKEDFIGVMLIVILGGFILSIMTLYNTIHNIGLVEGTRATLGLIRGSVLGDPNDLALYLLISFSFSICLFFSVFVPVKFRVIGLILSFIILYGIIVTKSRGGLLGLSGVLIYFLCTRLKSKSLGIIIGVLILLLLYLISGISHREGGGGLDVSVMNRIVAWKSAVNMALHHPIFGVGLGQFVNNFYNFASSNILNNPEFRTNIVAHSIWFQVLSEAGFIGLGFFILCIRAAFKSTNFVISEFKLLNNKNNEYQVYLIFAYGLYAALIGYCIAGSFLSQAFTGIFYYLFALSISLSYVVGNKHLKSAETHHENS